MNFLVSIIIPVYKVEQYLKKCVDSILCQTYSKMEVILVDDGSPDSSGIICDEYAKIDSRVIVIHKPNGGLSDARNVGLRSAVGDYILFIDSDDFWVSEVQLEMLMSKVVENLNCEFIGFNCSYYYPSQNKYSPWPAYSNDILNTSDRDELVVKLVKMGVFPMSACLKIIKRTFLIDNDILFIRGIVSEDVPWFLKLLHYSRNIRMVNQYIYAYRQCVPNSITQSFSLKSFNDLYEIIVKQIEYVQNGNWGKGVKDALLSFLAYEFCILLAYIRQMDKEVQMQKRMELMNYKWLLKYKMNPKVRNVAFCNKFLGIQCTELLLYLFLKFKH